MSSFVIQLIFLLKHTRFSIGLVLESAVMDYVLERAQTGSSFSAGKPSKLSTQVPCVNIRAARHIV